MLETPDKPNRYEGATVTPPSEDYRLIPLTQGQFAKVDAIDYWWISQWKWCAQWSKFSRSYYAMRANVNQDGTRSLCSMHRQILGLERGDKRLGDHINAHDTLDNRRSNLRIATPAQNAHNSRKHSHNTSGYKGVSLDKRKGRWYAHIKAGDVRRRLGYFDTPEAAHAAYCAAARELHGEFARGA